MKRDPYKSAWFNVLFYPALCFGIAAWSSCSTYKRDSCHDIRYKKLESKQEAKERMKDIREGRKFKRRFR
jgi:hypothetical protein